MSHIDYACCSFSVKKSRLSGLKMMEIMSIRDCSLAKFMVRCLENAIFGCFYILKSVLTLLCFLKFVTRLSFFLLRVCSEYYCC